MSYIRSDFFRVVPILLVTACLLTGPSAANAGGTKGVPSIIANNALLNKIYHSDPNTARRYAIEIEHQIDFSTDRGKARGGKGSELRFRGPLTRPDESTDKDILRTNRKDLDANPALKRLYQHSPLASLRMLTRLRETASKLKH